MIDDPGAIEQIEARLQRGWELIEEAQASADDQAVSRYTRYWLQLLEEYERQVSPSRSSQAHEPLR